MSEFRLLIVLCLLLSTIVLNAQTSNCIQFSYDAAGNRTSRVFSENCASVDDPCDMPGGCNQQITSTGGEAIATILPNSGITGGAQEVDKELLTDLKADSNKITTLDVELYPNPNAGSFQLNFKGLKTQESVEVVIYDATGRIVHRTRLTNTVNAIFLPGLAPGTYIIHFPNLDIRSKYLNIVY